MRLRDRCKDRLSVGCAVSPSSLSCFSDRACFPQCFAPCDEDDDDDDDDMA